MILKTEHGKGLITMLEFFLPMIPPTVTHQEKKFHVVNGKPACYEPAELKAARSKFMGYLGQHRPEMPIDGAVRLVTKWCYPCGEKHADGEYKTTKPDTDNSIKLFKDCMTRLGYWHDDAQVASEITEKFWSKIPGIYVMVTKL